MNKIIKVKAQMQNFRFFNGMRNISIKVFKIFSAEEKALNKVSVARLKKTEKEIRGFIMNLKKIHTEF